MKLHKDKYAFLTLIHKIHDRSRIREDILEKDYYVTLLLKELSEKQEQLPAYFKGGTIPTSLPIFWCLYTQGVPCALE